MDAVAVTELCGELIAEAADGVDPLRVFGVVFEFLAEPGDVDVDGPGAGGYVVFPDALEELFAADGGAAVLDEVAEELEFAGGERDEVAVADDVGLPEIDLDSTETEAALGRWGRGADAAEQDFDASEELGEFEGLGDVIVGAELEADYFIDGEAARGQHEDGEFEALLAELAADFEAIDAGERNVEQDQIEGLGGGALDGKLAGGGVIDGVAFGCEPVGQRHRERGLIFHYENSPWHKSERVSAE